MANAEVKSCTCWGGNINWVSDMHEHCCSEARQTAVPPVVVLNKHMTVHDMMHSDHVYGHRESLPGSPGTSVAAFTGKGVR